MTGFDTLSLIIGALAAGLALSVLLRTSTNLSARMLLHYLGSTLGNLFPLQLAALAVAWLIWCAARPTPPSLIGSMGLLLVAFAVVGFLVFLVRQFQSREALDCALREAFGESAFSHASPRWWRILRPLHFKQENVERIRDLSYGPAGERNLLDIYRPRDVMSRKKPLPVLLQIHGSGWMVTNKNMHALPLMYHMASQGWLVVAINYRLSPAARFPAHLIDVKRAIAWLRENIASYGGDPDFIAVTGGSAGGHLASLAALTPNRQNLQPGFEAADSSVNAVVPIYARYDFLDRDHANNMHAAFIKFVTRYIMPGSPEEVPDVWELASPVAQVCADAPPFFVIHGSHDSLIPVEIARAFVKRMRTVAKETVAYAELPGLQHGFDLVHSPATEFTIHAVHSFLEAQYRLYLKTHLEPAGSKP